MPTRRFLCVVGLLKMAVAAAVFAVGAFVDVCDPDGGRHAIAIYGFAATVGLAGHALCRATCRLPH